MANSVPSEIAAELSWHVQGWENNLNEAWHFLAAEWARGLTPAAASSKNVERIFPQLDATGHRHVFKAFDNLSPAEVRVVVLGQDPYPNEAQATGRAFEQGDLETFSARRPPVAYSLNKMLRRMVEATFAKDEAKVEAKGVELRKLLAHPRLQVASPTEVFDHLVAQGVLFLNASLTIPKCASRMNDSYLRGQLAFWRPFVQAVLHHLLARKGSTTVFLLMGRPAQKLFDDMTTGASALARGRVVRSRHPSANSFSSDANPFTLVNNELSAAGAQTVRWLPISY